MGWFSKTEKPQNGLTNGPQIEQRSHQNVSEQSDISHTLHQISDTKPSLIKGSNDDPENSIDAFIIQRPKNMFIIDGEKDSRESIICTSNESGGKTCVKLGISSISLFKHMQKLDYFCSLPDDIDATYFECRKIT